MLSAPDPAVAGMWSQHIIASVARSLVSYEDVQHYFDRKVLQEGKHASHQLASVMSVRKGPGTDGQCVSWSVL